MKRRFSLFTYPMMDMKAAEAELNRLDGGVVQETTGGRWATASGGV